ncbi:GcrA family cell cycle regulator [Brevundimonas sp. NPDC092305]|uniref:GcrA family cell cycle regulator n=1 Tax=Brevundimonas sp. NPDC092305 TaxID=3363957 RepID=UPI0038083694
MTTYDWTTDVVDRMTALWLDGLSAGAIALSLGAGMTRSAVLGKLHRLGVQRLEPARPKRLAATPGSAPGAERDRAASAPGPAPTARPAPEPSNLSPLATLLYVRRGECRWPLGDPGQGDLAVCGRIVSRGAYCACHAAMSYRGRRPINLLELAGLSDA